MRKAGPSTTHHLRALATAARSYSIRIGGIRVQARDGWLLQPLQVATFTGARSYYPIVEPGLLSHFLNISSAEDAQAFCEQYGALGWENHLHSEKIEALSPADRELATEYRTRRSHEWRDTICEPIAWIRSHVDLLNWCCRAALQDNKGLTVADAKPYPSRLHVLEQRKLLGSRKGRPPSALKITPLDYLLPALSGRALPWSSLFPLSERVADELNRHVRHVHRVVRQDPKNPRGQVLVWEGRSLLDELYYLVAESMYATGVQRLKNCATCGRVFEAQDPRTRFCPPINLAGSQPKGGITKSPCQERKRQRKRREALRAQGLTSRGKPPTRRAPLPSVG